MLVHVIFRIMSRIKAAVQKLLSAERKLFKYAFE